MSPHAGALSEVCTAWPRHGASHHFMSRRIGWVCWNDTLRRNRRARHRPLFMLFLCPPKWDVRLARQTIQSSRGEIRAECRRESAGRKPRGQARHLRDRARTQACRFERDEKNTRR